MNTRASLLFKWCNHFYRYDVIVEQHWCLCPGYGPTRSKHHSCMSKRISFDSLSTDRTNKILHHAMTSLFSPKLTDQPRPCSSSQRRNTPLYRLRPKPEHTHNNSSTREGLFGKKTVRFSQASISTQLHNIIVHGTGSIQKARCIENTSKRVARAEAKTHL